jgi:hypothetical protein
VRRATGKANPAESGGDIVDAAAKVWDIKDARLGADDIARTANRGENVLVDASGLSAAEQSILEQKVASKLDGGSGAVRFVPKR